MFAHHREVRRLPAEAAPAQDLESTRALLDIAGALPPVERAYALIRFGIFRTKFLALMNLILPERGRLLDVGCGFGLFSAYFALTAMGRTLDGVDPDGRRVRIAARVAERLGLSERVRYLCGTAETLPADGQYDAIYMMDVLHHLAADDQVTLLRALTRLLAPGGTLLLKDVTTDSPWRLRFTEGLDRVMIGRRAPLHYRHHEEWGHLLRWLGFSVRVVRVPDVLPYPHVVMVSKRA